MHGPASLWSRSGGQSKGLQNTQHEGQGMPQANTDRAQRQKMDGQGRQAFCPLVVRCLVCTVCLLVFSAFVHVPHTGDRSLALYWVSPIPTLQTACAAPAQTHSAQTPSDRTDSDRTGAERPSHQAVRQEHKSVVYDGQWLRTLETRIHDLLSPVYGEEHLVVQASFGDGQIPGHRPPVSIALIIDTAVLQGMPSSAEGLRAEQERLGTLVSHAAGLRSERGDSIAISFLLFSESSSTPLYLGAAGGGALLLLLCMVLLVRSRGRKVCHLPDRNPAPSVRKMTGTESERRERGTSRNASEGTREERLADASADDSEADLEAGPEESVPRAFRLHCASRRSAGEGSGLQDRLVVRMADRLRAERPQARAVVLGCLDLGDAARVLAALPRALQAETVACLTLQGHVEDEVLSLVAREFLQNRPLGATALFVGNADSARWTSDLLQLLPKSQSERIQEDVRSLSQRAWKRLQGQRAR